MAQGSLVARVGRDRRWKPSPCRWGVVILSCVVAVPRVRAIDGQSHKPSDEELERVFNDPDCRRTRGAGESGGEGGPGMVDWDRAREELHAVDFPHSMAIIAPVVKRLERVADLDKEAGVCPFGVIAIMFFFVKFLIETEAPQLDLAREYFSLLDGYSSGAHPHLIDASDWLVKDSRITALRRAMIRRLRPAVSQWGVDGAPGAGDSVQTAVIDASAEAQLRRPLFFVYDRETPEIRELSQGASFCSKGQWGMEVHIHEWLLASPHLTTDAEQADFFFVPSYSICMFEGGFFPLPALDEKYKQLVAALPYFKRNGGRDHVFTFGSGMSVNVFRSWKEFIPDSVFLTPETWLFNDFPQIVEPCFDTWKDVVIPGYLHKHEILSLAGSARPLRDREHFAVFLGRADPSRGPHPSDKGEPDVRGALRDLHDEGKIVVASKLSFPEMHALMGNARFCFVPKGKSAWSLRFFEALFANCVPVVLSDHWELPFEAFLDLPSFVVKWPMRDVGDGLLEALRNMPDEHVEAYMAAARAVRCWYVYPPLLHEVHPGAGGGGAGGVGSDMLRRVCPRISEQNAFAGIMRLMEQKRRVSYTGKRFFGPSSSIR